MLLEELPSEEELLPYGSFSFVSRPNSDTPTYATGRSSVLAYVSTHTEYVPATVLEIVVFALSGASAPSSSQYHNPSGVWTRMPTSLAEAAEKVRLSDPDPL